MPDFWGSQVPVLIRYESSPRAVCAIGLCSATIRNPFVRRCLENYRFGNHGESPEIALLPGIFVGDWNLYEGGRELHRSLERGIMVPFPTQQFIVVPQEDRESRSYWPFPHE